ncbi:manganese-dependent inorganic pyrophosphatase [Planctomycetales bacterium]|nr:manganese-dependent inorganic pyrophosphatase [Planctomycetales bacterium]GHS97441.1 manganese-dependent inorganic pyrophosphatase [Planctomycetales bacterium]GHV20525.1 manganese-dependent inorganic pyrophosphatase [Planctomycetales bacterium]
MLHKTYVIGHRNPDLDSIGAAHALVELRRRRGETNLYAACCGMPGARAEYVFKRFNTPLPLVLKDAHPRLRDIMTPNPLSIAADRPLLDAINILRQSQTNRLPVVNEHGKFCGMLGIFTLLDEMLLLSENSAGLTGRDVYSSLSLIIDVLRAESVNVRAPDAGQKFSVYVAAMGLESFIQHIPGDRPEELALVVGDRADIHLMAVNLGARLMIVTGARQVDEAVVAAAKERGVSILKTAYDSATVIRRLKFSSPVRALTLPKDTVFHEDDTLAAAGNQIRHLPDGLFPVVGADDRLLATFRSGDCSQQPISLILVDHNEFDNGVPGIESVPIVEIVDHHRFGLPPTTYPIKITCDVVGSTCTLVAEMYRREGVEPTPATAGILMGGILTDTMMLRSPTTTTRDHDAIKILEKIADVCAEDLNQEIFAVGSLIMQQTPRKILTSDKKDFTAGKRKFAIAQVEEVSFEPFYAHEDEILDVAERLRVGEQLDFFGLLVTNVVTQDSLMLAVGDAGLMRSAPFAKINGHLFNLRGIVSRKKQLLPQVSKWLAES